MWKAAAVMALFAASPAIGQVILVDARSSAKFLKPHKAPFQTHYPAGCGPNEKVEDSLRKQHGEKVVWREMTANGMAARVWESEKGWTMTVTNRQGTTCIAYHGDRRGGVSG